LFGLTKKMAIILAFLVIGLATNFTVNAFDSMVGEWTYKEETAEGHWIRGKLFVKENSIATYTANNGRIIFVASDGKGKWQGFWIEDGSEACSEAKDGSKHWGVTIFQFNADYSKFEGTWDMCGNGVELSWSGFR